MQMSNVNLKFALDFMLDDECVYNGSECDFIDHDTILNDNTNLLSMRCNHNLKLEY